MAPDATIGKIVEPEIGAMIELNRKSYSLRANATQVGSNFDALGTFAATASSRNVKCEFDYAPKERFESQQKSGTKVVQ